MAPAFRGDTGMSSFLPIMDLKDDDDPVGYREWCELYKPKRRKAGG